MNFKLVILSIFLLVTLTASADQLAWIKKPAAEKAVAFLKKQKQIILYCGCCVGEPKTKVNLSNVHYEKAEPDNPKSTFYKVVVVGTNTATDEKVDESIDLAYAWIKVKGNAVNLGWHLDMTCDPCSPAFNWETNDLISTLAAGKYKVNDEKVFEHSFLEIKKALEVGVGFYRPKFESRTTMIKVSRVELEADFHSKSIIIHHHGEGVEQRYSIQLKKVGEITINMGSISVKMKEDGKIIKEEFDDTELKYRMFAEYVEIETGELDIKLLKNFNVLLDTYRSMPREMEELPVEVQEVVQVNTMAGFFEAIGSNKHIIVKGGTYYITDLVEKLPTTYVSWHKIYDGFEPHITGVKNLTISSADTARFLIEPRYAWVMKFEKCSNISFSNLVFGHEIGGYCSGGCVAFDRSSDISFDSCSLYGSGTVGLDLEYVTNLTFNRSLIYECTYNLLNLTESKNLSFTQSTFRDTEGYNPVEIDACDSVAFSQCRFIDNGSISEFMPYLIKVGPECRALFFDACQFIDNKTLKFVNEMEKFEGIYQLSMDGCGGQGNSFEVTKE
jgi:hypothetical protein